MHPTIDSLTAYLERPDAAEFGETRRHIALCGQCRRQVQGLAKMIDELKSGAISLVRLNAGDEADDLEAFTDGMKHNQDKTALRAALHSAAHSAAMHEYLQAGGKPGQSESGDARHWWESLFAWRPHGWLALPATAAAAFAVAVMVLPVAVQETALIAAYQDDGELRFESTAEPPPGLGFFHNAATKSEPFGGMRVSYDPAAGLTLRWAAVAGARDYSVRVALVEAQGTDVLAEQDAAQPVVSFTALKLHPGRRYQWTLSGNTTQGYRFQTSGGFVMANNE